MSGQDKQQKSKGVLLCRSKQQPDGKEIQGLVFDHPSMPKIVTISCGARKKSSSGNHTTGHRARKEHNPTGGKYPAGEKYSTGHFTRQQTATGNSIPQPTTTVHYTPGQTYPRAYQTSAQCPPRSSPPALIHAPSQYSAHQPTPTTVRHFHGLKPAARVTEGRQTELPPQNGKSQIRPSTHPQNDPSAGIPLPATVTRDTHVQYPQHGTASQRAQETTLRRNSLGQRSENGMQHRQNIGQHSQNVPRNTINTIELGTDEFSRDFHLKVWRESHDRAANEWSPPERGQDLPVRRLAHPAHLPLTSGHNVDGTVARHRPLSTSAGEQPSLVFRGEMGHGLPVQQANLQGPPCPSNPSPRDMRRYSTGHLRLSYNADCPTGPQNSPEVCTYADYRQRVQSAEGMDTRVSTAGGIRRPSNTADENNLVARNAEGWNPQVLNSGHIRIPSNISEDCSLAVRNAEGRNLEVLNAGKIRTSTNTCEYHNPAVRSAEGKNLEVSSAGSIRKSSSFSNESESQANVEKRRRTPKQQYSPTVVVISDSDEDEMEILSPLSNGESDQDVFTLEPTKRTMEPRCVAREGLSPNDSSSGSEGGCIITKVKAPADEREQLLAKSQLKSTGLSKTGEESREYDVNNNESREGVGTSYERSREGMGTSYEQSRKRLGSDYRSVLCEREFAGQSGTQRVVMSEQVLFDKDKRGCKMSLEDKTQYFVAGSAQIAGSALDHALRKIRRISTNEIKSSDVGQRSYRMDNNTSHQSSQEKRAHVNSGETSKLTTYYEDIPMLIRSRSENDEQIGKQKVKNERSASLTHEPKTFESKIDGTFFNPDDIKKGERIANCKFSPTNGGETKPHCKVCLDGSICIVRVPEVLPETGASDAVSRDEIRCRNCDRVLNEYSPGNEVTRSVVKLPKSGPKPTGIVVGIKQEPEVKQPLESDTMGSENRLKKTRQSKAVGLEKELTQLMECNTVGSGKLAKNDIIYKDKIPSRKVSDDLDVLHFSADVTCTNSKDHVKSTTCSRDQVHPSQQWEAYSIKLEQEQMAKKSCGKNQKNFNIKRNSWEELKRRFSAEEKKFSEGKRGSVPCSGISERSHATRKRAHSPENVFDPSYSKSYKFQDATGRLSKQHKRRKLSEILAGSNSSDNVSESEALASRNNCENDTQSNAGSCEGQNTETRCEATTTTSSYFSAKVNPSDVLATTYSSYTGKNVKSVNCATQTAVTPDHRVEKPLGQTFNVDSIETSPSKIQEFNHSGEKPYEIRPSEEKPHEIQPSEETPFEKSTQENHSFEENTPEKDLYDIRSSDIRPSEVNTHDKDSYEIRSSDISSSEIEPISPGKELEAAKSPPKEELSLHEWTEILQGRIAQVRESIEEETTPWKTKNKKKVLEKLENHLVWMTGPSVDETIFVSRKMQFFQTMRKQYELMKKVKTHRQTMKSSDSTPQVAENLERSKGKAAKASKQRKEAKKTIKCKPKGVKNTGGTMIKKIRKAIAS